MCAGLLAGVGARVQQGGARRHFTGHPARGLAGGVSPAPSLLLLAFSRCSLHSPGCFMPFSLPSLQEANGRHGQVTGVKGPPP